MATSKPLKEIDEKFLQCSICMEQFIKPKSLPCLHRFCEACLEKLVGMNATEVECPHCREKHPLPPDGVKGFKTDFNANSLIEFIQQQSHSSDNDFPMCKKHPQTRLDLCCGTCDNQLICVPCSLDVHKGHNLQSVTAIVQLEVEKLNKKLKKFLPYYKDSKANIQKVQDEIVEKKKKLALAANAKTKSAQSDYNRIKEEIEKELRENDEKLERWKAAVEEGLKLEESQKTGSLRPKLGRANRADSMKQNFQGQLLELQQNHEKEKQTLVRKMNRLKTSLKCVLSSIQKEGQRQSEQIRLESDHVVEIKDYLEQIYKDALSSLRSKGDWLNVKRIPDICFRMDKCTTIDGTLAQVHNKLGALAVIATTNLAIVFNDKRMSVDIIEINDHDIDGVVKDGWTIDGITGINGAGIIVITGQASDYQSHLTVITMEGRQLRQNVFTSLAKSALRYCAFLSDSKVATACQYHEIGIYDTQYEKYDKKYIDTVSSICSVVEGISCIAVFNSYNNILVANVNNMDVNVFDSSLEHVQTLTLPKKIRSPINMLAQDDTIIVLDECKASLLARKASKFKLKYEFNKPDDNDLKPVSVSTDKNGLVYILWKSSDGPQSGILAQYHNDDGRLLQTVSLDKDASCIITVTVEKQELLLVASRSTGKLFSYQLLERI